MRLRNSSGSESKASSATLTNSSRSILHPLTPRGRSLRVAVVRVFILVIFFAVAFVLVFVFFLIGLLSKEHIRNGLAEIWRLALVPIELLLKARLRIGSPP